MTDDTTIQDRRDLRQQLLADLPVEERRLNLAGVSTAVLEGGDGPPLVLLHSAGEFAATWGPALAGLVRDHRVIAADLPGHGASLVSGGSLDAARTLHWLDELLGATRAAPATLVGHLAGGALAARYTIDQPDRVAHLVLVDSFGLGPFRPSPRFVFAMLGFVIRPRRSTQERLFQQCFADLDALRGQMGAQLELLEAYALERVQDRKVQAAIRALMRHFGVPRIPDDDLARIPVPVDLIWGRHDLQVSLTTAQRASERHGWPLHVIEGAAEAAFEQPSAFVAALHRALDDRSRSSWLQTSTRTAHQEAGT